MRYVLSLLLFSVIFNSVLEASMEELIVDSVKYIGRNPSDLGISFDTATEDHGLKVLEKVCREKNLAIVLTASAEGNKIIRISWFAKPTNESRAWSELYWHVASALTSHSFTAISRSCAFDGQVVLGDAVTHPSTGASYWVSLIEISAKIRVDMTYVIQKKEPGRFSITISSEATIPPAPVGPL